MSLEAWQVLSFFAGVATSALLMALLRKAGVDVLLSLYLRLARFWGHQVARYQHELIAAINARDPKAEAAAEKKLNHAIGALDDVTSLIDVRLRR
jgi:hypothetical protein